ncbi:MAG: calcium/sodium antiporter [Acidimicrobiia bacterium]|nr:calcium/sodium antiporter [Acidimicrobiia bacterium]
MLIAVVSFLGGLVLLLVAGRILVDASTRIGAVFGLPATVIGLTIVAGGTSAPELAVVLQSLRVGDPELAVGSIIGSNIANILLVLGLAALVGSIKVSSRVVRIDIPFMIAASLTVLVMAIDGQLSRGEGLLLVAALVAFISWTIRSNGRSEAEGRSTREAGAPSRTPDRSLRLAGARLSSWGWVAEMTLLGISIGGLAAAARFVVAGAEQIAINLDLPELIVGLTIVALGTSAPEIATTLVAAIKGQRDLAVGNAIGSNIFNLLLVLGLSSTIGSGGLSFSADAVSLDLPIMVVAAVACLPLVFWDHTLRRWEGGVFVAFYLAYLTFLGLDATDHWMGDPFAVVMVSFVAPITVLTIAVIIVRRHRRSADRHGQSGGQPDRVPTTRSSIGAFGGVQSNVDVS